jgi:hypothetical protein
MAMKKPSEMVFADLAVTTGLKGHVFTQILADDHHLRFMIVQNR